MLGIHAEPFRESCVCICTWHILLSAGGHLEIVGARGVHYLPCILHWLLKTATRNSRWNCRTGGVCGSHSPAMNICTAVMSVIMTQAGKVWVSGCSYCVVLICRTRYCFPVSQSILTCVVTQHNTYDRHVHRTFHVLSRTPDN